MNTKNVREFLVEKINQEILLYFRTVDDFPQKKYDEIIQRWTDDMSLYEKYQYDILERLLGPLKGKRILDMAAGCGSFVLYGLHHGYDVYGVEPSEWKLELIDLKFKEYKYPENWRQRIVKGVGEYLPFDSEFFDIIHSWQTIEHVQDQKKCIEEMHRVLKSGGAALIDGPNFFSFNEGHYRMLWFPMLNPNSKLARWYVGKIRKRPIDGLNYITFVHPWKLKKICKKVGFRVYNAKKIIIHQALAKRFPYVKKKPFSLLSSIAYVIWDLWLGIKQFGLAHRTISWLLIKQ